MEQTQHNNVCTSCDSCGGCKKAHGGCFPYSLAKILVIVGALNWGFVGVGAFLGGQNLNVVNLLIGSFPKIEWLVYVLVGIAGIAMITGCGCKTCKKGHRSGTCPIGSCNCGDTHSE